MRILATVVAALAIGIPAASAQTLGDAARRVGPDDTLFITRADGGTVKGRLVSISPSSIEVLTPDAVAIPADRIRKIEKQGDPLLDGFKRGAIAGAAVGVLSALATLRRQDMILFLPKVWTAAGEFGAFGLLVDAMHTGRTTIYKAAPEASVAIVPLTSRGSRGIAVALRF